MPTAKKKQLPRQKALPGMANRRIAVLENAALKYAEVRDERMDLTKQETAAKQRVKQLMHAQKIDHYARANIEISLEPVREDEKVIVRVRDRKAQDEGEQEQPKPVEEPEPDEEAPEVEEPEEDDPDAEYDSKEAS